MATKNEAINTTEAKEPMVKIRIPRDRRDEGDLFVSVNERTFIIQRGVEVEVPECVAEVIRNAEAMADEAYAFEKENAKG